MSGRKGAFVFDYLTTIFTLQRQNPPVKYQRTPLNQRQPGHYDSYYGRRSDVKRLSILILVFAIAFAFFIIAPGLLNKPFTPLAQLKIADVLDLFTPLVMIPLYYLLLYFGANQLPSLKSTIVFLVFAALWVEGQAMHLAANSISHWLSDFIGDQIYEVTYFYDEVLSHYIWHFGVIALSAQLIYRSWKYPFTDGSSQLGLESIAGAIFGLTVFIMGIEGGTVPLLFTFSVLAAIISLILGWGRFKHVPLLTYFLIGYALAALIFTGWGIYWSSFPQFSHLGWI
jgi:hypothetical protein